MVMIIKFVSVVFVLVFFVICISTISKTAPPSKALPRVSPRRGLYGRNTVMATRHIGRLLTDDYSDRAQAKDFVFIVYYKKSEADCERLVRQLQNDWIEYLGLIVKWAILVRRLNAVATRPSTRHRLKIIIVAIICK